MSNGGWVKLYRCLLDKPVWLMSTPEQRSVLITILLMVNHEPNKWEWKGQQFTVNPGQMITSAKSLCEKAGKGISRQNIRSSLKRFEKFDFLTIESTKQGMLISIINWESYQSTQPTTQPTTQPKPNQSPTTNKNIRNKEDNKPSPKVPFEGDTEEETYKTKKGKILSGKRLLSFDRFWDCFGYKDGKAESADSWFDIPSLTDTLVDQICNAAKIENSRRDKLKADGKTPKMAQGWLSGRRWEDEVYQEKINRINHTPVEQQQKFEEVFK